MKTFTRILAAFLMLAMLLPLGIVTSFADNVADNWTTLAVKYNRATEKILFSEGAPRISGFAFTETEDGGVHIYVPSNEEFGVDGTFATAVLASKNAVVLDGLTVTLKPDDDFVFDADSNSYPSLAVLWTDKPVTKMTSATGPNDTENQDLMFMKDAAALNSLRYLGDPNGNGVMVSVSNSFKAYNDTRVASNVNIVLYKDGFSDLSDGHPGYRWSFTSRNNTFSEAEENETPTDKSRITQSFECVEAGDLTVYFRTDAELGYVVTVNGKEYYDGTKVAYFPLDTGKLENADYEGQTEKYKTSMTYAKANIDLSSLNGIEGYVTAGIINNISSTFGCTLATINGVPAAQWKGETPGDHVHEFVLEKEVESECTVDGYKLYTCSCGAKYREANVHPGHDWVVIETVPATCTESGYKNRRCRACGLRDTVEIKPTGHSWYDKGNEFVIDTLDDVLFSEFEVTTRATPTSDGVLTRTCKNCGLEQTRAYKYSDADKIADNWYVSGENRMIYVDTYDGRYDYEGLVHTTVGSDGSITLEDAISYYEDGEGFNNITKITSTHPSDLNYFTATVTMLPANKDNPNRPYAISFMWTNKPDNYKYAGEFASGTYHYFTRLYSDGESIVARERDRETQTKLGKGTVRKFPKSYARGTAIESAVCGYAWEHYIRFEEYSYNITLLDYDILPGLGQFGTPYDNIYESVTYSSICRGDFWQIKFKHLTGANAVDATEPITIMSEYWYSPDEDSNYLGFTINDGESIPAETLADSQTYQPIYYFSVGAYGDGTYLNNGTGANKYGASFRLDDVCGVAPAEFTGYRDEMKCFISDDEYYEDHTWGEYHYEVDHTGKTIGIESCFSKGRMVRECEVCGASERISIPKTAHHISDTEIIKEPNCVERGTAKDFCDNKDKDTGRSHGWLDNEEYYLPVTGTHNWGPWTTLREPDENGEGGLYEHTCIDCGTVEQSDTQHIHSYGPWTTVKEPSCTEPGLEERTCSEDGYVDQREIPALGHDWSAWIIDEEATPEKPGLRHRTCSRCDAVEEEVIPKPISKLKDVPDGAWYTEAVYYCVGKGFMTGTGEDTFTPSGKLNRAMFVLILGKIDGADLEADEYAGTSFTDVPEGKWYSRAVQWAYKNGYSSGIGSGLFGPSDSVTRQQLATFFRTYSDNKGYDVTAQADLSKYDDVGDVSGWAEAGMKWAVGVGLISGTSETRLSPRTSATRAQIALIVMNYVENYVSKQTPLTEG